MDALLHVVSNFKSSDTQQIIYIWLESPWQDNQRNLLTFFISKLQRKIIAGHIIDNWPKCLFEKNGSPSIHTTGVNSFTKIGFDIISILVNFV